MSQSGQPGASEPGGMPPAPPPQAPPPPSWQSTPQPPSPPPMSGGPGPGQQMPAWTASLMDRSAVAGPAGFYYADVPNRIIAYIIDFIILFIVQLIVAIIAAIVAPATTLSGLTAVANPTFALIYGILAALVTAGYFIYTWVAMRGTIGMRLLGMQIGNETDGRTITYQQAAIRYLFLYGPFLIADILGRFALGLGLVLQLLGLIWFIVLLVTTAQSPTKQGLHDRYAKTMVVKAARTVA
ncbi:MAG: hypothetical protein QOH61_227 [Chloroflexota bacterium]|jgi:uncharacterized RDD family membrane protein YckC|nr:hypothetical protein [Chloroflexota bacterium]